MNIRLPLIVALTLGFGAAACGPAHVQSYQPKKREYELPEASKDTNEAASSGSLWHDGRPASMLFTDARALRMNDLVVIKIEEVADARRSANTDIDRSSASSAEISAFLGALAKVNGGKDQIKIGGSSNASFNSEGKTGRSEYLTATVPAVVRKVLPNGNLFIEGHRVILVNAEEQHFYISGVVRPIDIDQENSVKSAMVADAEIEFVGRGVLTDNQKQGWLSRFLGWILALLMQLPLAPTMNVRAKHNRKLARALTLALAFLAAAVAAAWAPPAGAAPVRVKELVDVQGVRENALYGYGLVVGLAGTGDSERVFFTSQSISGMLGRLGIRIDPRDVRTRNVAAVMVTARLPSFARPGTKIDVSVSSLGNARSLAGGVLLITPLTGPDGAVYALAQGSVQAGGFDVAAAGSRLQKNQPTSGSVPGGANVERAVTPNLDAKPVLLGLRRPDFTTATRIADAINKSVGEEVATALDPAAVEVKVPEKFKGKTVTLLAQLEALEVDPDQRARIVVSERTGTVVAGQGVRIREVAVAHGGLSIAVTQTPYVSQPGALAQGRTVSGKQASVDVRENSQPVVGLPSTTSIDDLVKALNLLGVGARDLVAVLQAMKAAGAIDAELEVL